MTLPEFSVKHPVAASVIFIGALLIGGFCITQMPVDLLPDIEVPAISVLTPYPGAAPEDVESKVTDVLERFLATVPELKHITSSSREDLSIITLSFEWGTDLDTRANEVRDMVGLAKIRLPEEAEEPRVVKMDVSRMPIVVFGIEAGESYLRLEKILDDLLVKPLKRLPGVASADMRVPLVRQVNVYTDRERLAAYGLTQTDVARAVGRENRTTPGGSLKMGTTDYLVRTPGEFSDVRPMQQIVLKASRGAIVHLADVGTASDSFKDREMYVAINGRPGGAVIVQKESGANTVTVARKAIKAMEQLKKRLPPDVRVNTVMDASEVVTWTIRDLLATLVMGMLLCMGVVLVFLRQWRATLIIALAMPFSLIMAFVAAYFLGYTINMMTLFGLTIAVGMVVDNAIVVLENITRHREEGERPSEAAVYGASEVGLAISASTLTTICIFFPLLFVKGILKIIFSEFAVVVTVTLLASLFTAMTMTPMLSATILSRASSEEAARRKRFFAVTERLFDRLADRYAALLGWALRHRPGVLAASAVLVAASFLLVSRLGSEFMPDQDQASITGQIYMPVGTRVEETVAALRRINAILEKEIRPEERMALFVRAGTSPSGIAGAIMGMEEGAHIGQFSARLVPKTRRKRHVSEIAAILRHRIAAERTMLGIEKFRVDTGDPMAAMVLGGEKPLTINVAGNDLHLTDEIAARIRNIVAETLGAVDVSVTREKGRPELWVKVDRDKAASLGLNVADVGDAVRSAVHGITAGKYRVEGDEYDIHVRLREQDRSSTADLEKLTVPLQPGRLIRIGDVAAVGLEHGPVEIQRKDQIRIVNVVGNVQGRSLGEVVSDIRSKLIKLHIPPGVYVGIAGQTEQMEESFMWMAIAIAIGAALVYMVMAAQFESYADPFVVMFAMPLALAGTIFGLLLFGHRISIVSLLGVLLLVGVVVNNAIVLVDYTNILRQRGLPLFEAVQEAGRTRLRPVLMTALTTIVALIPMALGRGQGSEANNPLGVSFLGGMILSTAVTLVIVPVIYSLVHRRSDEQTTSK